MLASTQLKELWIPVLVLAIEKITVHFEIVPPKHVSHNIPEGLLTKAGPAVQLQH